jgi:eukaryotic-like serine/threonine-protein kinase
MAKKSRAKSSRTTNSDRVARPESVWSKRRPATNPLETTRLLDDCRIGNEAAAREVFDRYLVRLTALARSRISPKLAARFDADDVVMSAYRSFFVGLRDDAFVVDNGHELWQLLVQITLRKLYHQVARHTAAKRNAKRDRRANRSDASQMELPVRAVTPADAAAVADELQWILSQLPPLARRMLELRLQGSGILEIAAEVRINERTVRRWLARVQKIVVARSESRIDCGSAANGSALPKKSSKRPVVHVQLPDSLLRARYQDYDLQKMIGAGASGKVYRALCRGDGRRYAVKFLRKSFSADLAAIKRFIDESSLVASLRHRNIMPVLAAGRTPWGGYFFVMPLADATFKRRSDRGLRSSKQSPGSSKLPPPSNTFMIAGWFIATLNRAICCYRVGSFASRISA